MRAMASETLAFVRRSRVCLVVNCEHDVFGFRSLYWDGLVLCHASWQSMGAIEILRQMHGRPSVLGRGGRHGVWRRGG